MTRKRIFSLGLFFGVVFIFLLSSYLFLLKKYQFSLIEQIKFTSPQKNMRYPLGQPVTIKTLHLGSLKNITPQSFPVLYIMSTQDDSDTFIEENTKANGGKIDGFSLAENGLIWDGKNVLVGGIRSELIPGEYTMTLVIYSDSFCEVLCRPDEKKYNDITELYSFDSDVFSLY